MKPGEVFLVGTVGRPVGLRGEVQVEVLSDNPERFAAGSRLIEASSGRELTVRASRRNRNGRVVSFAEIKDRPGAEALGGADLVVPAAAARELGDQEYWDHDLIGCEVATPDGRSVGRVTDVLHSPANEVLVVRGPGGERLVALVAGTVMDVEPGSRITVDPSSLGDD